ncbi:MAG: alpha/beta hydrolase [Deltaproteobacteria bacterium]|nr:alpha/beta hydrolase [Deltaproteobacteria bacterium]
MIEKDYFLNILEKKIFVKELIVDESKKGPTLIFLHEGLGCTAMWKDFPHKLAENTGLNAFIYDRIGYGKSDLTEEKRDDFYLHNEALKYLPRIIEQTGLKDIILIGHSDGGSIALLYASKYPVRGLVTEAAHVFVEDITIAGIKDAVEIYKNTDLKEKLKKYHGDKTEIVFKDWSEIWLSDPFRAWNIEDCLPGITHPLLVIQGNDDEYATIKQVDSIVNKTSCSTESAIVPDCKHVPHFQSKDVVLAKITDFVSKLASIE